MANYVSQTNTRAQKGVQSQPNVLYLSGRGGQAKLQQKRSRLAFIKQSIQPSRLLATATKRFKANKITHQLKAHFPQIAFILFSCLMGYLILRDSLKFPNKPVVRSEWGEGISKAEYDKLVIEFYGVANKTKTKPQENTNTTSTVVSRVLSQTKKPVVQTVSAKEPESNIEALVRSYFPEEPEVMLAVFKHESGLTPTAQGWNCWYGADGTLKTHKTLPSDKSKACKKTDRGSAWSTDCGVVQNNFPGTVCPDYSFNPEWSVKEGRRKYDVNEAAKKGTGKLRWSSYKNGSYKKYL